jgi:hypothetical protein
LERAAEKAAVGIDIVHYQARHIGIGDTHEGKGSRLLCDNADLDR